LLNKVLLTKVRDAPRFGIQFDETADLTRKAQLIAHARLPDKERMKVLDHYLFRFPTGIGTTAASVFSTVVPNWGTRLPRGCQ